MKKGGIMRNTYLFRKFQWSGTWSSSLEVLFGSGHTRLGGVLFRLFKNFQMSTSGVRNTCKGTHQQVSNNTHKKQSQKKNGSKSLPTLVVCQLLGCIRQLKRVHILIVSHSNVPYCIYRRAIRVSCGGKGQTKA